MQWHFLVRLEHFVGITLAFNLSSHRTTPMNFVVPALTAWKMASTAKTMLLTLKLTRSCSSTKLRQSQCRAWIISFPRRQPLQGMGLFIQSTGWAPLSLIGMSRATKALLLQSSQHTWWGVYKFQLASSQTRQPRRSSQDQTWQHPRRQRTGSMGAPQVTVSALTFSMPFRCLQEQAEDELPEGTTANRNSFPRQFRLPATLLCYAAAPENSDFNTKLKSSNVTSSKSLSCAHEWE